MRPDRRDHGHRINVRGREHLTNISRDLYAREGLFGSLQRLRPLVTNDRDSGVGGGMEIPNNIGPPVTVSDDSYFDHISPLLVLLAPIRKPPRRQERQ